MVGVVAVVVVAERVVEGHVVVAEEVVVVTKCRVQLGRD